MSRFLYVCSWITHTHTLAAPCHTLWQWILPNPELGLTVRKKMSQAMALLRIWLAHFALRGGSLSPPRTGPGLLRLPAFRGTAIVRRSAPSCEYSQPSLATDSSDRSECTCFSARWRRLATGSIRPAGWLQTQMQLQVLNTVMVFVSGCLTLTPFALSQRSVTAPCAESNRPHPAQVIRT